MKKINLKKPGFTLVELIIVMAMFSIIFGAALALLNPISNLFKTSSEYYDQRANGLNMMNLIEERVKYADKVVIYTGYKELPAVSIDYTKYDKIETILLSNSKDRTFNNKTYKGIIEYCSTIPTPSNPAEGMYKPSQYGIYNWKFEVRAGTGTADKANLYTTISCLKDGKVRYKSETCLTLQNLSLNPVISDQEIQTITATDAFEIGENNYIVFYTLKDAYRKGQNLGTSSQASSN